MPRKIAAIPAACGLLIQRRAALHEIRDIGDVDAQFPITAFELLEADRIVKVFGIIRIDRADHFIAQVQSCRPMLRAVEAIDRLPRLIFHRIGKIRRQIELHDHRAQIDVFFACFSEDFRDHAGCRLTILAGISRQLDDDFSAGLHVARRRVRRENRLGKRLAIRQHQPLAMLLHECAYKFFLGPLENLDDSSFVQRLALAAAPRVGDLGRDDISIDRPAVLPRRYIQILVAPRVPRLDEAKSLAVMPIHANDRPRGLLLRRQNHRSLAAQNHPPLPHQIAQRRAKRMVFLFSNFQLARQFARPQWPAARRLEVIHNLRFNLFFCHK